jgi:hypothetical protein
VNWPTTREEWLRRLARIAWDDRITSAAFLRRVRDLAFVEREDEQPPADSLDALRQVTDDDIARLAIAIRRSIRADAVIAADEEAGW